jgi:DNA primase
MSVTDEIKSRLDIVDVVSDYLPLRKSGSSYTGFCPFHPNTRTPAFVVFPSTQTWRCFGACAEGGDVFSFVMKKEGWDFKEALAQLAQRAGVSLAEPDPKQRAQQAAEDRLINLLTAAADYFQQLLAFAPQADHARRYVTERGLAQETVETFRIGYALDSWDACRSHFSTQGYDDSDLLGAGLLTENEEKGARYDRFRNRLMIPICDASGRVVGFGARTLDPDGLPKYLNSPQTDVFDKGRLLFGLDLAKRHIREAREAVVVEGYLDVMQAWQAGYRNVVAQMGTALTEAQLRSLKRYSKRFVLALDADAAGGQATLRSLEVAREVLDREPDARFDARGLVRHIGRLQADIQVVTLPEGSDPDKLIRTDAARWPELIAQAKPIVAYVIDVATDGLDLNDARAKTTAAQQVLPVINDLADPVERDHYRQQLARKLRIDERALHKVSIPSSHRHATRPADSGSLAERRPGSPDKSGEKGLMAIIRGGSAAADLRRANFLRQCLSYPQIMAQIDKQLALNQQPVIGPTDFSRPDDRALWFLLRREADRWPVVAARELWDSLEDEFLRDRVQMLMALPESPESELDRLPDLLVLSVLDWRLENVKGLIDEVRQLFRESQTQADSEMLQLYSQQLLDLPLQVRSINKARGAMSALGRRTPRDALDVA